MIIIMLALNGIAMLCMLPGILKIIEWKHNGLGDSKVVRASGYVFVAGCIGVVVFSVFALWSWLDKAETWVVAVFLSFVLLGVFLILAYINIIVVYNKDGFTSYGLFGLAKTYSYGQITGITYGMEVVLHLSTGKVKLDVLSVKSMEFIAYCAGKPRNVNGKKIYGIPEKKYKLFNGNVSDPGGVVFGLVVLGVLTIGMFIFMLSIKIPVDDYPAIITVQEISTEGPDVVIIAKEAKKPFYIYDYSSQKMEYEKFISEIHPGDRLDVLLETEIDKVPEAWDGNELFGIFSNKVEYLNFANVVDAAKRNKLGLVILTFVFVIISGIIIVLSVKVMSNPNKYPKWMVKGFGSRF